MAFETNCQKWFLARILIAWYRKLAAEKELSQQLAQEKVQQGQKHKKLIR